MCTKQALGSYVHTEELNQRSRKVASGLALSVLLLAHVLWLFD